MDVVSIVVSFGRYGGFYWRRRPSPRICLGWMIVVAIPVEFEDLLPFASHESYRPRRP